LANGNDFSDAISTTLSSNDGFYNENISYDNMGYILTMKRYEKSGNFAVLIDDLTYTYANGYFIDRIDDAVTISGGFVDAVKQPAEYRYDGNGNQLKDLNRGITGISYNLLNLQQAVTNLNGNSVTFVYDADGNKLRKLSTIGSTTTTTEYISGLQYEYTGGTPLIAFVTTGEGRAHKSGRDI
jgi:YD repeat-containing protein